jgi:hypothetical protein
LEKFSSSRSGDNNKAKGKDFTIPCVVTNKAKGKTNHNLRQSLNTQLNAAEKTHIFYIENINSVLHPKDHCQLFHHSSTSWYPCSH